MPKNTEKKLLNLIRQYKRLGNPIMNHHKMFNMMAIEEQMDMLLSQLQQEAERSPEVESALQLIESAKELLITYGDRLRSVPNASRSLDSQGNDNKELLESVTTSLNEVIPALQDVMMSIRNDGKFYNLDDQSVMEDLDIIDDLWKKYRNIWKASKSIKSVPYYLNTADGTIYSDMQKYLIKSISRGKTLTSHQISNRAKAWHDTLVSDYGYGTSKDWNNFLKMLSDMAQYPDKYKGGYGNDQLKQGLTNFTKLLISSEMPTRTMSENEY